MSSEFDPGASYDSVPYPSYPCTKCHPRNLSVLATLFGMAPADVRQSRVLEIGCANGGNLLPIALANPDSEFIGIDASGKQIEAGQETIAELQLSNVDLQRQDILDFDSRIGQFDYIICHGVYSWVPRQVQDKILAVCREHLKTNGVAYVSYNTLPGWYLRRGVREMMRYHAKGFDGEQEKIDQSRALLEFLIGAVNSGGDAYEMLLDEELKIIQACEDSYLFHEHLEDCNEPLFFNEFIDRSDRAGLRFLGEAHFSTMMAHDFSDEVQATLRDIAPDIIRTEQYLDFLRNRKFRQTLLTHKETELNRAVEPSSILAMYASTSLTPLGEDSQDELLEDGEDPSDCFVHPNGRKASVKSPLIKSAISTLANAWPSEIAVRELARVAWEEASDEPQGSFEDFLAELSATLLECYSQDIADLVSQPCSAVTTVSEKPIASPISRYQAAATYIVTNERHESAQLNDFDRSMIEKLDGTISTSELVDEVIGRVERNEISLEGNDSPTRDDVTNAVEQCLSELARAALLIG